ncbi:unnamed protein product [Chilo suppressalis]|uniref:lysozyme n=1 Tax=Chilo suppressalis TaxID=168631 RepID=A0ABN8BEA7_CHISP|nr:unnamed protein product [Chilo suppressalis]
MFNSSLFSFLSPDNGRAYLTFSIYCSWHIFPCPTLVRILWLGLPNKSSFDCLHITMMDVYIIQFSSPFPFRLRIFFRMKLLLILVTVVVTVCLQCEAKTFTVCELVHELRKQKFPENEMRDYQFLIPEVCLVEMESTRRTHVTGSPNSDGSKDHGLFQINDRYWCNDSNVPGKECHVTCGLRMGGAGWARGEARVADDSDFETLKKLLSSSEGWTLEYEKDGVKVWAEDAAHGALRTVKQDSNFGLKMRLRNYTFYKVH